MKTKISQLFGRYVNIMNKNTSASHKRTKRYKFLYNSFMSQNMVMYLYLSAFSTCPFQHQNKDFLTLQDLHTWRARTLQPHGREQRGINFCTQWSTIFLNRSRKKDCLWQLQGVIMRGWGLHRNNTGQNITCFVLHQWRED